MPQSLAQLYVHIIFSTKNRFPFIRPEIESELYAYLGGVIKNIGGIPIIINGMPDHIHILTSLPKTLSLSKFMEEIKRNSSRWIKTKDMAYQKFAWQSGYAAFSVSSSGKDAVLKYIERQKDHHKKDMYKDEVLRFLEAYNINYDKQYLWD